MNNKIIFYGIIFLFTLMIVPSVSAYFCYQEFANNNSNGCGFASGSYDLSFSNYVYINYTLPLNANSNSLWMVHISDQASQNLSIPSQCFYEAIITNTLQVRLYSNVSPSFTPQLTSADCYDGNNWTILVNYSLSLTPTGTSPNSNSVVIDGNFTSGVCGYRDVANIWGDNGGGGFLTTGGMCEGGGIFEESMYWSITCNPNWVQVPEQCINNIQFTHFIDANSCQTNAGLPLNNGTNDYCVITIHNKQEFNPEVLLYIFLLIMLIIITIIGFIFPMAFWIGLLPLVMMIAVNIQYNLDNIFTFVEVFMMLLYIGLAIIITNIRK